MIIEMNITERELVIASGNIGKIKEFRNFLQPFPFQISAQPDDVVVEETGKTFLENARLKALAISEITGKWALADDSGLCVDALAGAPGLYSARYGENDSERISRLLAEMQGIENRKAIFHASICIVTPLKKVVIEVEGISRGLITRKARGTAGFGYDPIFEVIPIGLTYAEMSPEQKAIFGHRGKAFKKLESFLRKSN
tara:strand:+ start:769 stop:1365 length:597 start_codon:yes stop_codon:yes gene_type:complete